MFGYHYHHKLKLVDNNSLILFWGNYPMAHIRLRSHQGRIQCLETGTHGKRVGEHFKKRRNTYKSTPPPPPPFPPLDPSMDRIIGNCADILLHALLGLYMSFSGSVFHSRQHHSRIMVVTLCAEYEIVFLIITKKR